VSVSRPIAGHHQAFAEIVPDVDVPAAVLAPHAAGTHLATQCSV
jgi:hypothetical protein